MHKRTLLLGTTGIKKSIIATNIQNALHSEYGHSLKVINFEKEYFDKSSHYRNMAGFLTLEKSTQHQIWNDAWKSFSQDLKKIINDDIPIILILHGVYVNEGYGVRSFLDFKDVCEDFCPSLIITLIDDIYNMWWRTESYANGDRNKGRPTFEQLLMARRTEITIGDLITCQNSLKDPAKHVVCSVNHPIKTLINLIVFNAKIVYFSFPISEPRRLSKNGNNTFVEAINSLHHLAIERKNNKIIYISPLTIDELPICFEAAPIIQKLEENKKKIEGEEIIFDRSKRWQLSDLWNNSELLNDNTPDIPSTIRIPVSQLQNICGIIKTDIGWRDYKLVDQADALSIFCPIPPGRDEVTRGVMGEWQKAITKSIPCYVYQEPTWDPKNIIGSHTDNPGSMNSQPLNSGSLHVKRIEELYERCETI